MSIISRNKARNVIAKHAAVMRGDDRPIRKALSIGDAATLPWRTAVDGVKEDD